MLLFGHSVVSDSLQPHGLQDARLLCPSPSPGASSLVSIESVMPSNHLILCCPLLLLPSIFPSIRVFSEESTLCIRWPKYWSINLIIVLPVNIQGWFPLALTGLILQSKGLSRVSPKPSSNASILWHSDFFIVQLLHPYMITRKTITLARLTFVGKVISLLFNTLSRLVIAFLPRNKCLNFMAAVTISSDFGAQGNKAYHCFHCFLICLPLSDGIPWS